MDDPTAGQDLDRSEYSRDRMANLQPKLTVILCTHNRQEFLKKCLASLATQSCAAEHFEVLIVDNASSDSTSEVSADFVNQHSNFRYHMEPKLGLARARNAGLERTNAPLAAFTDDDAIPANDWVERILARFDDLPENIVLLAGEIDPIWESARPDWLTDSLLRPMSAHLGWDTIARPLRGNEWVCEVNCCYRTEVIKRYGGFPEALGRKGELLLSGENYVNDQIFADGYRSFFDPAIRVRHFIPAERITKTWLMRRSFWQGITASVCAKYDHQEGRKAEYWQNVRLPANAEDWRSILDASNTSRSVEEGCELITNIGYMLGIRNMVIGR
ncbi:MAG: glycosyltransferase family 2 protein [Proteobacteria bacterium]|nr:glycosyltransferase family 2 protein [Pseudomonadota bacterium]